METLSICRISDQKSEYGDYIPLIKWFITPILTLKSVGVSEMIVFDRLWDVMKCGIDSQTIRRLRANENVETKTLDKLCRALSCRLEDIAEYIADKPKQ